MANTYLTNTADINQFEYCYLTEDTDPEATYMKIYVPKLMGMIDMNNKPEQDSVAASIIKNANSDVSNSATTQGFILAKVQEPYMHKHPHHDCPGNCINVSHPNTCGSSSKLADCPHFHHDHHFRHRKAYGKIPAGTQLICCIMDHNIKDIIVTRMWCRFPEEQDESYRPPNWHVKRIS